MKYGLSVHNLTAIVETLKRFPEIGAAYLYGSRAKGNFKPASDIDIALKGENLRVYNLLKITNDLEELYLPYTFDLSIYNQIDNTALLDHIDRVGINLLKDQNN